MIYQFLADAVVIVHLLFIVFALVGALLALWRRWILLIHIPVAVWASLIMFAKWTCPLTPLEKWLRIAGGGEGYDGGFIAHYLVPILFSGGMTPAIQIGMGITAISFNVLAYSYVIRRFVRGNGAAG